MVKIGYQRGVPMGGELPPVSEGSKAPSFLVWAIKDANSGNRPEGRTIAGMRGELTAAYVIGAVAAFWVIERTVAFWT